MAVHFTGIKGTGMAALAGILADEGFEVNGSDIDKYIFTQDELEKRHIPVTSFDPDTIHSGDTVIVGLSFDEHHPEAARAPGGSHRGGVLVQRVSGPASGAV